MFFIVLDDFIRAFFFESLVVFLKFNTENPLIELFNKAIPKEESEDFGIRVFLTIYKAGSSDLIYKIYSKRKSPNIE